MRATGVVKVGYGVLPVAAEAVACALFPLSHSTPPLDHCCCCKASQSRIHMCGTVYSRLVDSVLVREQDLVTVPVESGEL